MPVAQIRLILTAMLLVSTAAFAEEPWHVSVGLRAIDANGEKSLHRPNGKTVSTDIDGGSGIDVALRRSLTDRWSLSLAYFGSSEHRVTLRQDFPDGTDFSTSDTFDFDALALGFPYELLAKSGWRLALEPFVAFVSYDDVYLQSAGPPFDQQAPLNLDIEDEIGVGARLALESRFSDSRWRWYVDTRLLVVKFEGTTYPNPDFPGTSSSIELDFNSLMLGIGVGYDF